MDCNPCGITTRSTIRVLLFCWYSMSYGMNIRVVETGKVEKRYYFISRFFPFFPVMFYFFSTFAFYQVPSYVRLSNYAVCF